MRTKSHRNRRVILGVNKPGTITLQPIPVQQESVSNGLHRMMLLEHLV